MSLKKICSLFVILIAGFACKSSKQQPMSYNALNGEWKVVAIENREVAKDLEAPVVTFDTENNRVSGFAGCNRINAAVAKESNDGTLVLGPAMSTRMACLNMELENALIKAMGEINGYKMEGGKTPALILTNKENKEVLKLIRK
ncbi:MAG: META domain-containing protein [Tannerellaceae bacterium]|nr:hypothetical protein [Porphyromonadaceae bacterium]